MSSLLQNRQQQSTENWKTYIQNYLYIKHANHVKQYGNLFPSRYVKVIPE